MLLENQLLCGDYWDYKAGNVVCRELGFGPVKEIFSDKRFGKVESEFLKNIPLCDGSESSIDQCKFILNKEPCENLAGVVCSRVIEKKGVTLLDGEPVCKNGFSDVEASALCKEKGYRDGVVTPGNHSTAEKGWSMQCTSTNLHNCDLKVGNALFDSSFTKEIPSSLVHAQKALLLHSL